jgi:methylmalonyl-CoA/ethylmalonyl-CoA epimerase
MAALRFHHTGIACRDIAETLAFVASVHAVVERSAIVHDAGQDADVCLLTLADGSALELVSGPVVANLVRKGISSYHVCYEVADLDAAIADLTSQRCRVVSGPTPAPLFDGRQVAFLFSPIGLIELLAAR